MRPKAIPPRAPEEVLEAYPWHRQSVLADADTCMLATKWRLEGLEALPRLREVPQTSPWNTAEQSRGILAHRYAAEVLNTLWATGEVSMPVAEALEILYEVCAQRDVADEDVVYLPARERRLLRMFAVRVVSQDGQLRRWNMERLFAVEERLWATVTYTRPDGSTVKRTITGAPDAVLTDGADGVVVLDWKTTPKAPAKAPERKADENGDLLGDRVPGNVSYEGFFQQRVYALLILANMPNISRVTLRELYPLDPDGLQVRKATVLRADLERIERELSVTIELLDRALSGGSKSALWKPQAGKHCAYCPRVRACTIDPDERMAHDGIATQAQAAEVGAAFVWSDAIRGQTREAAKAYHEATGLPIPVKTSKGRLELRHATGTRSFGMHVPDESDRGPLDRNLTAIFKGAAERRRAAT